MLNNKSNPVRGKRLCLASREHREQDNLIRFVLDADRTVVPDLHHVLPGRGVWVTANAAFLDRAIEEGMFRKGFKCRCTVVGDLRTRVGSLLRQQARELLSLANKAGKVTVGFEKTLAELEQRQPRLLLEASDGAHDGRRKLRAKKKERCEIIGVFTSSELDLALGRTNVIHAAIAAGGLADRLLWASRRIEAYECGWAGLHG